MRKYRAGKLVGHGGTGDTYSLAEAERTKGRTKPKKKAGRSWMEDGDSAHWVSARGKSKGKRGKKRSGSQR